MPRYKTSNRDAALNETRQMLIDAAADEFARHGYDGANVNSISLAAGFAKGTVYNYFPSKQALMLALIEQIAQNHVAFVADQVMREADPRHRLEHFFEAGFAWVTNNLPQARVMLATLNSPNAEHKQAMFQAYEPMFGLVERDILEAGMAAGVFRQVERRATSGLLMNIYLGAASQLNEQGTPWLDHRQVADFVLHALRP